MVRRRASRHGEAGFTTDPAQQVPFFVAQIIWTFDQADQPYVIADGAPAEDRFAEGGPLAVAATDLRADEPPRLHALQRITGGDGRTASSLRWGLRSMPEQTASPYHAAGVRWPGGDVSAGPG